jgi:prevent-host-death family protein
MIRLNVNEAKTRLSSLLDRVAAGEVVLVCKRNVPVAEIRPVAGALAAGAGEGRPAGEDGGWKDRWEGLAAGVAEPVAPYQVGRHRRNRPELYPELPPLLTDAEVAQLLDEVRGDR